MRAFFVAAVFLALVAGCLGPSAPASSPAPDPTAEETRLGRTADLGDGDKPGPTSPGAGDLDAPLLVNVSAQLRKSAAEIVVPAGEFHVVRLVYDNEIWDEEEPWDGSAQVQVGYVYDFIGDGVFMRGFGFKPPSFVDDETIRPYVDFLPLQGKGWGWSMTSSSCSGCDGVPKHEMAMLVGGPGGATLRIGVLSSGQEPESLWDRPALPVGADAGTRDAFAGIGARAISLATEYTLEGGILDGTWSDSLVPGVSAQRTAEYHAGASAVEPGIFSVRLYAGETVGVEQWSYALTAPQMAGGWEGVWTHDPQHLATALTLTGAAYPPIVTAQGNIGVGPVQFEAARSVNGASEPAGLVSPSYEFATIGHAGIDLDTLFGWATSRPPSPNAGFLHCAETSATPGVRHCLGRDG